MVQDSLQRNVRGTVAYSKFLAPNLRYHVGMTLYFLPLYIFLHQGSNRAWYMTGTRY